MFIYISIVLTILLYIYAYEVSDRTLGPNSNIKVYRAREGVPGHPQCNPAGYPYLRTKSYRFS